MAGGRFTQPGSRRANFGPLSASMRGFGEGGKKRCQAVGAKPARRAEHCTDVRRSFARRPPPGSRFVPIGTGQGHQNRTYCTNLWRREKAGSVRLTLHSGRPVRRVGACGSRSLDFIRASTRPRAHRRLTLRTDLSNAARSAECPASGTPSIAFSGAAGASTLAIVWPGLATASRGSGGVGRSVGSAG